MDSAVSGLLTEITVKTEGGVRVTLERVCIRRLQVLRPRRLYSDDAVVGRLETTSASGLVVGVSEVVVAAEHGRLPVQTVQTFQTVNGGSATGGHDCQLWTVRWK